MHNLHHKPQGGQVRHSQPPSDAPYLCSHQRMANKTRAVNFFTGGKFRMSSIASENNCAMSRYTRPSPAAPSRWWKLDLELSTGTNTRANVQLLSYTFPFCVFLYLYQSVSQSVSRIYRNPYGTTQADWGNAVFGSFCLVYCKACSTLTKTGIKYIFLQNLKLSGGSIFSLSYLVQIIWYGQIFVVENIH